MKKQLTICFALSMLLTTAFSQLTIIPKAGITYANIGMSDDMLEGGEKPKYKVGLQLGAGFEITVNKFLAIQPELLFHQKGWRTDYSEDGFSSKTSALLNYIELPILVEAKFGKFYVDAGPSIALGIGGKYKYEYSSQGDTEKGDGKIKFGKEPDDNEEDIYLDNAVDFGLQMGGGVKAGPLVIDFRYGIGLSNIQDSLDGFNGDWKMKNRSFQLTVGFPIILGGK